jgi:hypothetical protein
MGSPAYKVYDSRGQYQAACKEPEAAAVLVSWYGDGASIRWGHAKSHTVWTEGTDGRAAESYDATTTTILGRVQARHERSYAQVYGRGLR